MSNPAVLNVQSPSGGGMQPSVVYHSTPQPSGQPGIQPAGVAGPGGVVVLPNLGPMVAPAEMLQVDMRAGQMVQGQAPTMVQPAPAQAGRAHAELMPAPPRYHWCPAGLEYLVALDGLIIHQQIDLEGILAHRLSRFHYVIKNTSGQRIYMADEPEDDACCRCGNGGCQARAFTINIKDNLGQEVVRIRRDCKCCAGCGCCACANCHGSLFVSVESPPGTTIGYVRQTYSLGRPRFDIRDAADQCVLKIRGPDSQCNCGGQGTDRRFQLLTKDLTTELGGITKEWGGWVRETLGQMDTFNLKFPQDLDVKTKTLIIAGTFLIDAIYYER